MALDSGFPAGSENEREAEGFFRSKREDAREAELLELYAQVKELMLARNKLTGLLQNILIAYDCTCPPGNECMNLGDVIYEVRKELT